MIYRALWARASIAVAIAMVFAFQAMAQAPAQTTTRARAIELVRDFLHQGGNLEPSEQSLWMQAEAHVALLSLTTGGELRASLEALADLTRQIERNASQLVDLTRPVQEARTVEEWMTDAAALAFSRGDVDRAMAIVNSLFAGKADASRQGIWAKVLDRAPRDIRVRMIERAGRDVLHAIGPQAAYARDLDLLRRYLVASDLPPLDRAKLLANAGDTAAAIQIGGSILNAAGPLSDGDFIDLVGMTRTFARQGDTERTLDLVERIIARATPRQLLRMFFGDWPFRHLDRSSMQDSVMALSQSPFGNHGPPNPRYWIEILAESIAAVAPSPKSRALLATLSNLLDAESVRLGLGPLEVMLLRADWENLDDDVRSARLDMAAALEQSREMVAVAQIAIGVPANELVHLPRFPWHYYQTMARHPRTALVRILASPSEAVRAALGPEWRCLRAGALVLQGQVDGDAASFMPRCLEQWWWRPSVLGAINELQLAGHMAEAKSAIAAYIETDTAEPLSDLVDLAEDIGEPSVLRAVYHRLRQFSVADFFLAVRVRQLGDSVDMLGLLNMVDPSDPEEVVGAWLDLIDALASVADTDGIEQVLRSSPGSLSRLSSEQITAVVGNAKGLHAIALARQGRLEDAIRLVGARSLDERRIHPVKRGYDISEPVFDVRYLVREWIVRGHGKE